MKPTNTPFQKLIEKVKSDHPKLKERTIQSLDWYSKKIEKEFGSKTQSPLSIYETQSKKLPAFPGQLITFKYMPKDTRSLPIYDEFPLILTLSIDTKSILGLNFHYLKPLHRVMFMNELYKYLGTRFDEPIIDVDYTMLMKKTPLMYYKPCIRRYLFKNVSQRISIIPQEEWELALFLPTEKFTSHVGESTNKRKIWEHSAEVIRKK
jgi:hypothetical protein